MFHVYPPKEGVEYTPLVQSVIGQTQAIGDRYSILLVVGISAKTNEQESQLVWGHRWSDGRIQTQGPIPYEERHETGMNRTDWEDLTDPRVRLVTCGNAPMKQFVSVTEDLYDDLGIEWLSSVKCPDGLSLVDQVRYVLNTFVDRHKYMM